MLASFRAESLKLRKRPAVWVLGTIWFALVVLFGYALTYAIFANPPEGAVPPGTDPDEVLRVLYPKNVLSNVLSGFSSTGGGPIALILGALAAGSEYGWGTQKTVLTQRPGRLAAFFGKTLVLALIVLVFVLLAFAAGAASSYVIANIEDAAMNWPTVEDTFRAVGAGWLIMIVWTAVGILLATLFRGTALAIGLGLVYALALEGIAASLLAQNEDFNPVRKALLGENSNALVEYFGSIPAAFGVPDPLVDADRAVLTLAAYAVGLLLLAALVFRRRDVT